MTREKTPNSVQPRKLLPIDRVMLAIGSVPSLIVHSCIFTLFFLSAFLHIVTVELVLLVLTTIVSLEAIYLAIFIQMAVNRNTQSLLDVEEDIEEIQEDVGEIQEDVAEVQEDVGEIQEEILDEQEDLFGNKTALGNGDARGEVSIERIQGDLERLLKDIEALRSVKKE